jgi:hypothetical protein
MIDINIDIVNPWSSQYKLARSFTGPLTKHKFWELQFMKTNSWLCLKFSWTVDRDHAGLNIELALMTLALAFTVYDHRHWDSLAQEFQDHA